MSLSIESSVGDLLDNPQTKDILEQHIPGISSHPQIEMARGLPLPTLASYSAGLITDEMVSAVAASLADAA